MIDHSSEGLKATESSARPIRFFLKAALLNLFLVSAAGVVMRYKIEFPLPGVNMKYLLHGHSHFAFAGWVSLALMAAIFEKMAASGSVRIRWGIKPVLWAQLITAFGMFISFPLQGYGAVSITFSTLSILNSWLFVYMVWPAGARVDSSKSAVMALKTALLLNVLSAAGTFYLVSLMISGAHNQTLYFGAVYTFLHFQYNGWFLFGVMSLFLLHAPSVTGKNIQTGVFLQAAAAVPAVFLSMLWMKLSWPLYAAAVLSALIQLAGLFYFGAGLRNWKTGASSLRRSKTALLLWVLSFCALAIRTLLQFLSVFPALGKFAFAYRPVVIGFLHLMLLGCITLFLLGFLAQRGLLNFENRVHKTGIYLFLTGFLFTETVLMGQGLLYMGWATLPHSNLLLFIFAVVMSTGLLLLQWPARDKMAQTILA